MHVFQFIAALSALLFAGAAIYITLAEHPARMQCGTAVAATVFGPSYRRAAVMQVILALLGTVGGLGAWFTGATLPWLVGALLLFAVIPFTLIAIAPVNKQLLNPAIDPASDHVLRMLKQWGRLHMVRSILGLASSILLLASLVWASPTL